MQEAATLPWKQKREQIAQGSLPAMHVIGEQHSTRAVFGQPGEGPSVEVNLFVIGNVSLQWTALQHRLAAAAEVQFSRRRS